MLGARARETRETRQCAGAALDHLDPDDDALGVAVRGLLVEVGESSALQSRAPSAKAAKAGSWERSTAARKRSRAALGLGAVRGAVDKTWRKASLSAQASAISSSPWNSAQSPRRSRSVGRSRALSRRWLAGAPEVRGRASSSPLWRAPFGRRRPASRGARAGPSRARRRIRWKWSTTIRAPGSSLWIAWRWGLVCIDRDDLYGAPALLGQRAQAALYLAAAAPSSTSTTRLRSRSEIRDGSRPRRGWARRATSAALAGPRDASQARCQARTPGRVD
jgi:hypothetical protein